MYDAFNLARADAVVVINNATNSGTANPDMMMSYMKPFIGDIPDILT